MMVSFGYPLKIFMFECKILCDRNKILNKLVLYEIVYGETTSK